MLATRMTSRVASTLRDTLPKQNNPGLSWVKGGAKRRNRSRRPPRGTKRRTDIRLIMRACVALESRRAPSLPKRGKVRATRAVRKSNKMRKRDVLPVQPSASLITASLPGKVTLISRQWVKGKVETPRSYIPPLLEFTHVSPRYLYCIIGRYIHKMRKGIE